MSHGRYRAGGGVEGDGPVSRADAFAAKRPLYLLYLAGEDDVITRAVGRNGRFGGIEPSRYGTPMFFSVAGYTIPGGVFVKRENLASVGCSGPNEKLEAHFGLGQGALEKELTPTDPWSEDMFDAWRDASVNIYSGKAPTAEMVEALKELKIGYLVLDPVSEEGA